MTRKIEPTYRGHVACAEPPKLKTLRLRTPREGRCHELAGRTLLAAPEDTPWRLVQGYWGNLNKHVLHSWLEVDDLIYCAVHNAFFTRAKYLQKFYAWGVHEFTRRECEAMHAERGWAVFRYCGPGLIFYVNGEWLGEDVVLAMAREQGKR